jgi:hypothetical protein
MASAVDDALDGVFALCDRLSAAEARALAARIGAHDADVQAGFVARRAHVFAALAAAAAAGAAAGAGPNEQSHPHCANLTPAEAQYRVGAAAEARARFAASLHPLVDARTGGLRDAASAERFLALAAALPPAATTARIMALRAVIATRAPDALRALTSALPAHDLVGSWARAAEAGGQGTLAAAALGALRHLAWGSHPAHDPALAAAVARLASLGAPLGAAVAEAARALQRRWRAAAAAAP